MTEPLEFHAATLAAIIDEGTRMLESAGIAFGHGTSCAADEAAWLVLWQLGLPLDTHFSGEDSSNTAQLPVTDAQKEMLAALFTQRIQTRKPTAYLTREAWLQGVPFYVDERAIVPRSFIAELLANGSLDEWLSDRTERVLDLCTGNGSLACLAAMVYPEVRVVGADISPDALEVARINVEKHGLQQRVMLAQSDGLAALSDRWDLVLCNPPYVNADSMAKLPAEYLAEPELALAGGHDGMDFVRQLLKDLPQRLNPEGVLVLEIGNEKPFFEAAFPDLPVFWLDTSAGDEQVLLVTQEALTSLGRH